MADTRITIIDDDPDVTDILKDLLHMAGYQVSTAFDGRTGIELVKEEKPALIILDIKLPDMDGLFLCEIFKKYEETKDIPVIMLTGKSMGSDFEKAMDRDADWYIVKPFNNDHLLKVVKKLIALNR